MGARVPGLRGSGFLAEDLSTPTLSRDEIRERVRTARAGSLGTLGEDGRPHLVPIVFAVIADTLYFAVDQKPKTSTRLQRVKNIERDPRASVLVAEYSDDWIRLWWCRLDGEGRVVADGDEEDAAVNALVEKYAPYQESLPAGPVVAIDITGWHGWSFA